MKLTINLGDKEVLMIERALDLYVRISLLQLERMYDVPDFNKVVYSENAYIDFEGCITDLKYALGYESNASKGIFSPEVSDNTRLMAYMVQRIRYERLKGNANKPDICSIAGIKEPEFKFL